MRRRAWIAGAALAGALLVGTTIQAQRGGPGGRGGNDGQPGPNGPAPVGQVGPGGPAAQQGPGGPNPGAAGGGILAPGLDLTADQQAKIRELTRTGRDQSANIADELDLARKQLRREVFADARNSAKITELTTKIMAFEKQLLDIRVKSEVAVADVLTAEQRQTVRASAPGAGRGPMGVGPVQGGPQQGPGPGRAAGRGNG